MEGFEGGRANVTLINWKTTRYVVFKLNLAGFRQLLVGNSANFRTNIAAYLLSIIDSIAAKNRQPCLLYNLIKHVYYIHNLLRVASITTHSIIRAANFCSLFKNRINLSPEFFCHWPSWFLGIIGEKLCIPLEPLSIIFTVCTLYMGFRGRGA